VPDSESISRLLAQAFPDRIARRRGLDGRYQLANGMGAMLDSDDALTRHEWLIAPLLLQGSHSRMRVSCRRLPSILTP
jgi:ATP-dependent helicase HrpB